MTPCSACRKPFEPVYRNGLKLSRKCDDCQPAKQRTPLKRGKRPRPSRDPRKRLDVNWEVTRAFAFRDKRSVVTFEGRMELHGKDMSRMRELVLERDSYMCVTCTSQLDLQIDHILSKGQHPRDDRPMNLQTLCRTCHQAKHNRDPKWTPKDTPTEVPA